jgi:hypothetical protein
MTDIDTSREMPIGDDLVIMWLPVAEVKEQDINAQVMQPRHFDRLTQNIADRGMVESLPFAHWPERKGAVSIISGHHRARAARAAGLTHIPFIVDLQKMARSAVRAKQIAHNELHGSPDEAILAQLIGQIDNADDLLASGLDEAHLPSIAKDGTSLGLPHADFTYHMVTLAFLDRQLTNFQEVLDAVDPHAEVIGLADRGQWEEFAKRVIDFGRSRNIRSVAAAVAVLSEIALREIIKGPDAGG